ncbi:MAG: aminotransferase class I/II-fold pyridoxal phosphate-dependent enzyme [Pseudomonadota bacterium]
MSDAQRSPLRPVSPTLAEGAYRPPSRPPYIDLLLDGNEGRPPALRVGALLDAAGPDLLRRYPDAAPLAARIAARHGLDPARVLATAGADDGLDRCIRAYADAGRAVVHTEPTFEMIPRYARLAGAQVHGVPWAGGPFPLAAILEAAGEAPGVLAVVSPNNPTGAVVTREDLVALSRARPEALLLVDLAYGDFADEDLTAAALDLPNAVVLRTFSKALGMAGLRVGYALGPIEVIDALRAAGHPYAVSGPSIRLVMASLERGVTEADDYVRRARDERRELEELLARLGLGPSPSQGNFVFLRPPGGARDAVSLHGDLAALGISVRQFPGRQGLEDGLRITCPGDPVEFARLAAALETSRAPEALLFDMDGVLADVSGSYHAAIKAAAGAFGVDVDDGTIRAAKEQPGANNDWELTRRLLGAAGRAVSFDEARDAFEAVYQGSSAQPGLWIRETLIPTREVLASLARRLPLGIVTGRPRQDAQRFLQIHDLTPLFPVVVCMEDAPLKPDPAPVRLALERLGLRRAWLLGDTPDDLTAARAAGVLPLGIVPPGGGPARADALRAAGAARILDRIDDLEEALP